MTNRSPQTGQARRRLPAAGAALALLPSLALVASQAVPMATPATAAPLPGARATSSHGVAALSMTQGGRRHARPAKWEFSYHRSGVFRTSDGYMYRLTLSLQVGQPRPGNSTSLPPGQYAVGEPVAGKVVVTNMTGRDAQDPLPLQATNIDGLWRSPSPLCPSNAFGAVPDAVHEVIGGRWYCLVTFATVNGSGSSLAPHRALRETVVSPSAGSIANSKAQVPKVMAALRAGPAMVLMAYAISDTSQVVCDNQGNAVWVVHTNVPLPAHSCHPLTNRGIAPATGS